MAQTLSQSNPKNVYRCATGRILDTGTVAAMVLTVGFKPRIVRVVNNTSGDEELWVEGMADASAMKRLAAGTNSLIVSNGITVSDSGFTLGLDTDILVSNEQITWYAEG